MQIGVEGIENLFMVMVLEKKKLSKHKNSKRQTPFYSSLLRNWLYKFHFGIIQRQFKVFLLKPIFMNHCQ
jgi:hypothetical protein